MNPALHTYEFHSVRLFPMLDDEIQTLMVMAARLLVNVTSRLSVSDDHLYFSCTKAEKEWVQGNQPPDCPFIFAHGVLTQVDRPIIEPLVGTIWDCLKTLFPEGGKFPKRLKEWVGGERYTIRLQTPLERIMEDLGAVHRRVSKPLLRVVESFLEAAQTLEMNLMAVVALADDHVLVHWPCLRTHVEFQMNGDTPQCHWTLRAANEVESWGSVDWKGQETLDLVTHKVAAHLDRHANLLAEPRAAVPPPAQMIQMRMPNGKLMWMRITTELGYGNSGEESESEDDE
jgi:hypothetical protein